MSHAKKWVCNHKVLTVLSEKIITPHSQVRQPRQRYKIVEVGWLDFVDSNHRSQHYYTGLVVL